MSHNKAIDFSQLFLKCSHFGDGGITQLSQTDNLSFTAKTAQWSGHSWTNSHDAPPQLSWSYITVIMILHVCHDGLTIGCVPRRDSEVTVVTQRSKMGLRPAQQRWRWQTCIGYGLRDFKKNLKQTKYSRAGLPPTGPTEMKMTTIRTLLMIMDWGK